MSKILMIKDKFYISSNDIGWMIECRPVTDNDFKIGDILYDVDATELCLFGIPHINYGDAKKFCNKLFNDMLILAFKSQNKTEHIKGRFLTTEDVPHKVSFLYTANPLDFEMPDEEYFNEYVASNNTFDKMLFSYEELVYNHKLKIDKIIPGIAIYRGWMLKPEQYEELYDLLSEKGIYLINSVKDYKRCHLFPNWYKYLEGKTSNSLFTKSNDIDEAVELAKRFNGPIMIKDYVKSRKHEWNDACYIEDPKSDNARQVITNFVKRQADTFVGGIVIREFVDLVQIGNHEISKMPIYEEYRFFVLGGNIIAIIAYWGNSVDKLGKDDMKFINSIIEYMGSNFYTIDVARKKTDNKLIVIEIGDGQVSGLQEFSEDEFYESINKIIYCGDE